MLDRASRDFFETRKNKNFKIQKYIQSQNINMPANGIMFISLAHEKSQINYLVKKFKIGASFLKNLKFNKIFSIFFISIYLNS